MQNERIKNLNIEILSDNWFTLNKATYHFLKHDGSWQKQEREAYDRGNGAVILLYNQEKNSVILTRQFRLPTYINGNPDGMLIEACAGLLDHDHPEVCIKKEAEEETGYRLSSVEKVFEAYMSPGSVTEILYFFIAAYSDTMKVSNGGGIASEQEDIEVLELEFHKALKMVSEGKIRDGKTIMLLQYLQLQTILRA